MLAEEVEGYLQTVAFDVTEIYFNSEKNSDEEMKKLELLNQKLKKKCMSKLMKVFVNRRLLK